MRVFCFLLLLFPAVTLTASEATRTWTSSDGKTIEGTIKGLEENILKLETDRGLFEVPLERFSEEDQLFAREWAKNEAAMAAENSKTDPAENMAPVLGAFDDLKLGEWPQYVTDELEIDLIEEIEGSDAKAEVGDEEETETGELFIYRTPHFEFRSPDRLSKSVVREFARIFEATFNFVDQMPIGLAPMPSANGYYITKLYMSTDDYYADGGMAGSGGMFSWRRRGNEMSGVIKVPLSNLGVEYTGTRFVVDQNKRSTTLTHEITHQVMMRWLATPMPTWLSEGIAEFVSSQNFDNGRFKLSSMDRAVSEEITRGQGRDFRMVGAEKLMNISSAEWASELASGFGGQNYNSASALAYYFLRLDGNGDAAYLVEFLKALVSGDKKAMEEAQSEFLLRGRSYEELEKDIAEAWRSEGLKIEFPGS